MPRRSRPRPPRFEPPRPQTDASTLTAFNVGMNTEDAFGEDEEDAKSDAAAAGSDDGSESDLMPVRIFVSTLAGTFGGEEALAIDVSHDATVGQLKAKLKDAMIASERPLTNGFWECKFFVMGSPPEAKDCSSDYTRIMYAASVQKALQECTGAPKTLTCSIVQQTVE